MAEYKISVNLSGVLDSARAAVNGQVFPLLKQAVRAVAQQTQVNWMESVTRAKLWSGEKDAYVASIDMRMTGDFSALVWSDYRYAEEIENGRPAKDLKRMLDTSLKVRVSKQGKRYLIIPFRHNASDLESTPINTMTSTVSAYDLAKKLTPSRITGKGKRLSGTGAFGIKSKRPLMVNKNKYSWGESLDRQNEEIPKNLKGLYRFDSKTPGSSKQYSQYLTFRVMSESSSGWIVPPKPGLFLAKKVAEDMQPLAETAFQEAMKRSV